MIHSRRSLGAPLLRAALFAVFAVHLIVASDVALAASRHRAVRSRCTTPTLALSIAPAAVCRNEVATVSWLASDPTARVTIPGIGTNLPASGIRQITVVQATSFTGSATSVCGTSQAAGASIALRADPSGTIAAPDTLQQGSSTDVVITANNTASWTLNSYLGNPLFPSTGSGSGTFSTTYSASTAGTDTLQLDLFGLCGGTALNTVRSVRVSAPTPTPTPTPVPQPPPPGGTLRCCDGTLSPTCTSCANKQGCCSGHKGVCGC
jgi:hypothetical protein